MNALAIGDRLKDYDVRGGPRVLVVVGIRGASVDVKNERTGRKTTINIGSIYFDDEKRRKRSKGFLRLAGGAA